MHTISIWLEAMRLRTLPVSVAGVMTATAFSIADGVFNPVPTTLCLIFAVLCQISSNFANEYYDYRAGRDAAGREGPRRGVTEGDISPRAMKAATFATMAAAMLTGLSLTLYGGLWLIAAGALIGVGALAYSTGPWPLSTHAMGEAAVFFFFGIVPVTLTYYVQAGCFSVPVLLAGAATGLMGANVLLVNNYRDIADDRAVGKRTLSNILPPPATPALYMANAVLAMAALGPVWQTLPAWWAAVPAAYMLSAAAVSIKMRRTAGRALTPLLGITSMLMFAVAACLLVAAI